jgi:hypothetical protein
LISCFYTVFGRRLIVSLAIKLLQQYQRLVILPRNPGESGKALLASITGSVDQELLLRNEYLVTENRMLRHQMTGRVHLSDGERKILAEIG